MKNIINILLLSIVSLSGVSFADSVFPEGSLHSKIAEGELITENDLTPDNVTEPMTPTENILTFGLGRLTPSRVAQRMVIAAVNENATDVLHTALQNLQAIIAYQVNNLGENAEGAANEHNVNVMFDNGEFYLEFSAALRRVGRERRFVNFLQQNGLGRRFVDPDFDPASWDDIALDQGAQGNNPSDNTPIGFPADDLPRVQQVQEAGTTIHAWVMDLPIEEELVHPTTAAQRRALVLYPFLATIGLMAAAAYGANCL